MPTGGLEGVGVGETDLSERVLDLSERVLRGDGGGDPYAVWPMPMINSGD